MRRWQRLFFVLLQALLIVLLGVFVGAGYAFGIVGNRFVTQ